MGNWGEITRINAGITCLLTAFWAHFVDVLGLPFDCQKLGCMSPGARGQCQVVAKGKRAKWW